MKIADNPNKMRRITFLFWLLVAVLPALIALRGIFSLSEIFYLRDLQNYFYPHYLWIRHAVFAGHLPLWNPDSGAGYANVGDPSLQLFFLPTMVFRLLLPEVVGFNYMVVFPFVAAAIGTFLFLKRHTVLASAALGAIVFSVSGPLLSASNCITPATTVAMLPWLLWATDNFFADKSVVRFSIISSFFTLGFFAGQPDMLAWASVLVVLYAGFAIKHPESGIRTSIKQMLLISGSAIVGFLLSAIQFLPLLDVLRRSHRGAGLMNDRWSIHPLSLIECIMPTPFSSTLEPTAHLHPWLYQLNQAREPYLISIYLGVAALILGLVGASAGRPRQLAVFWTTAFCLCLILSLGYYTPVYQALRAGLPFLGIFRYPSKLTIFMAFALSILTAIGFEALKEYTNKREKKRAFLAPLSFSSVLILLSGILTILVFFFPHQAGSLFTIIAGIFGLDNSTEPISDMVYQMKQSAPRLFGLALFSVVLIWISISGRKEAELTKKILFAAIIFDLLMANAGLNPTIEVSKLASPHWVAATRANPNDRVLVDEQSTISPTPVSPNFTFYIAPDVSLSQAAAEYHAILPYNSILFGLRDAFIVDVTNLRSQDYAQMMKLFRTKDATSRARFLRRIGVRYFMQPEPPEFEYKILQSVPTSGNNNFVLYEAKDVLPRVSVVPQAEVEPNLQQQFEQLFSAYFDPTKKVLLNNTPPEMSGKPGQSASASAIILAETPTRLSVQAIVPEGGGYLSVSDTYDPNWQVEVDGERAPLLQANGLYRAVHLSQGEHLVRFFYRSRPLYWGAIISGITASLLLFFCWRSRKVNVAVEETVAEPAELQVFES